MKRDRSCEFPFCIKLALKTCPHCHKWLCGEEGLNHLKNHSCASVNVWQEARPLYDSLRPDEFEVVKKGGKTKVRVDLRKGPTRKEWRKIIDR